jgi:hypothetical protein
MTRRDLKCVHEPFGDAYYFGPERLGYRYEGPENEQARQESGYANSTYRSIFDRIAKDNAEVRCILFVQLASLLRDAFPFSIRVTSNGCIPSAGSHDRHVLFCGSFERVEVTLH